MATLGANAEASNKITLSILEDLHSHVSGGKLTQAKGAMEYVCGCCNEKTLLICRSGRCYPQGYVASRAKEAAVVCIACVLQRLDTIDTMKLDVNAPIDCRAASEWLSQLQPIPDPYSCSSLAVLCQPQTH